MNVKRYIAPNVQEAMIKIKSELGRDAIILHTRKIRQKGIMGFFKKPLVEVVAAIEEEQTTPVVKQQPRVEPLVQNTPVINKPIQQAPLQYNQQNPYVKPVEKVVVDPVTEKKNESSEELNHLKTEIDEIKHLLKNYMVNREDSNADELDIIKEEKEPENKVEKEIRDFLKELELNDQIIEKIFTIVKRQVSMTDGNGQMIRSAVRQAIKEYIGQPFTVDHFLGDQRVFVFVGPTGVGKTTTLAKLAAKLSLLDNKKVGLITADTYRIAAVDQLKTYSEILGIPLSVVYEASELGDVMFKYSDKDVILLDTAGRSHKSEELSRDLQDLLNNLEKPEIFLVLSLTTGYKDIMSILDAYNFVDDYKIIFTKLDEASSFSNILNVKIDSGKTLSYLTTGQSVPDDIEIASPDKVVEYIIGEVK